MPFCWACPAPQASLALIILSGYLKTSQQNEAGQVHGSKNTWRGACRSIVCEWVGETVPWPALETINRWPLYYYVNRGTRSVSITNGKDSKRSSNNQLYPTRLYIRRLPWTFNHRSEVSPRETHTYLRDSNSVSSSSRSEVVRSVVALYNRYISNKQGGGHHHHQHYYHHHQPQHQQRHLWSALKWD